ncbi:MAG: LEA type 2 family protein [Bacteroidota bacterium]
MKTQVLLILFVVFVGCGVIKKSSHKIKALSKCKFELIAVDKKVSFTQHVGNIWNYVIEIKIGAINPNSEDISLSGYKFDLYANDKLVSNISTEEHLILKADTTTIINAKTIISPSGVWSIFWKNLMNKKIEYKIAGTFYLRIGIFYLPIQVNLIKIVDNPN